jgi:ABC-2 type transport system permease protein
VYAIVYGLIHTGIVLLALVVFFGLDLSHANFATAVVFTIVGSFSIVGIGMMAAILPLLYVERGAQLTFVLQSVLVLFSGVYYRIEILPAWMQTISRLSPGYYILGAVRGGLMDGVSVGELISNLWPLLIMAVVLIPLGVWMFGRAERYAKRTGKLKRAG